MRSSHWGKSPKQSVEQACERWGQGAVVKGCTDLMNGKRVDDELILALGGPPAEWIRTGEPSGPDYWLRVWGARGLLYAWEDSARPAIIRALNDDAWRVRDMALKVVARHGIHEAAGQVAHLRDDPSARVRQSALRTEKALSG
ncbi:HEAT repeat domain-containing protein [Nocardioides panacisoli]|uniref:HEAT repeat domain-containing protein n=1 Tax=Nocardioides panacisoli TaxID=627624 RepID=A0ABP7J2F2_9ACTN